jgi:excisionase family DNA binding protein
MPTLARRPAAQPFEANVSGGLHFALASLAASLAAQVSSVVAKQVRAQRWSTDAAIRKSLKLLMPELLEREFTRGLLDNVQGVRERRAMLVHVLTTADVHALHLSPLEAVSKAAEDDESLTSEEAAELLHVSRTHLNGLLEAGSIAGWSRTAVGHRRIPKAAVLEYKEVSKQRQARGLEAMAQASQSLGLYKDELTGVPRRAKR